MAVRRVSAGDQAVAEGVADQLGPVPHAGLGEEVVDVRFDRRIRDKEPLRDFAVGQPFGHKDQDVSLPRGQAAGSFGGRGRPGTGDQACPLTPGECLKEASLDGRVQLGFTGGDRDKGVLDFLGVGVLGQEPPRAGPQGREHPLIVGVGGQDDNANGGCSLAEEVGGFDAVHDRHVKVHQDDVGPQHLHLTDGVGAVDGRSDDLDTLQQTQDHRQAVPDHLLVIRDQHPHLRFMHRRLPSAQFHQHLTGHSRMGPRRERPGKISTPGWIRPKADCGKIPAMNSSRQWLTPLGLAMVALVVLTAGLNSPGFAATGSGLLNALAALGFALAAVPFLIRDNFPPAAYTALTSLMALAVVGMRAADPAGEVIALFLLAAFAPLRPPRAVLAAVTLLGVLAFNVFQLSSGHSALTLILATDAGAAFFFLVGTLLRREKEQRLRITGLLQELQASREAEQAATLAAERGRMAREMHDVLAHTLSGLVLQLEGARLLAQNTNTDARLLETLQKAQQLSRSGLAEARKAVRALRGEDLPGAQSIDTLVDQHRLVSNGVTHYRSQGQPVPLSPEAALALYRAAQEALSNVRKHAPGSDVDVELVWGPDTVDLRITNTGSGIPEPAADPGYGLTGMTERADLAGGTVTTGPHDGGFRVHLSLPYPPG